MYQEILENIRTWMNKGGTVVEISKAPASNIWETMVKDNNGIYLVYTVGENNKDFIFDLMEFCDQNNYPLNIITMAALQDNR